jgi:hypothetical protein
MLNFNDDLYKEAGGKGSQDAIIKCALFPDEQLGQEAFFAFS